MCYTSCKVFLCTGVLQSMKKGIVCFLFVSLTFLNFSCSNFLPFQNLNEKNELYITPVSIDSHSIVSFSTIDSNDTISIPSGTQTIIDFTISNSYPYVLAMTPSSDSVFTSLPVIDHINGDTSTAELVFTLDVTEEHKTVDVVISSSTQDGIRPFDDYALSVFCNSSPSALINPNKSFSTDTNACVFYGTLPSEPSDFDIVSAEIEFYQAGTNTLVDSVIIDPFDKKYNIRPAGIPSDFVHTENSFYYYNEKPTVDYDWGISFTDSYGLESASVYTSPLLLPEISAVTADIESGSYVIEGYGETLFPITFSSATEDSVIEYRIATGSGDFSDWINTGGLVYIHNFLEGVYTIQMRAYKLTFPYSPVAEFEYTILPNNLASLTIPNLVDSPIDVTLEAANPADSSVLALESGAYGIPSLASGISLTASVLPTGAYTLTWDLYNSDGSLNTTATTVVTGDSVEYSNVSSGFYTVIVEAEDSDGNSGMAFVPLFTRY